MYQHTSLYIYIYIYIYISHFGLKIRPDMLKPKKEILDYIQEMGFIN
jgi:hypothetical protein